MKKTRRLMSIICVALIVFMLLPIKVMAVDPSVVNAHIPQNVTITQLKVEENSAGDRFLVVEASWDFDENISLYELYPFVSDSSGGLYLMPSENGQSVGNEASGAPEEVRFTSENGRSKYTFKLRILKDDEEQFRQDENGKFAVGLRPGQVCVFMMTALVGTEQGAYETDYSDPVEFTYNDGPAIPDPEPVPPTQTPDPVTTPNPQPSTPNKQLITWIAVGVGVAGLALVGGGALIGVGLVVGKKKKEKKEKEKKDCVTITIVHKALDSQYQSKMPPNRIIEVEKSPNSVWVDATPVERFKPHEDRGLVLDALTDHIHTFHYEANFVTITLECNAVKTMYQNRMPAPQKFVVDKSHYAYTVPAPIVDKFTSREKSWTFNNLLKDQNHTFEYEAEFLNLTIHYKAKDAQYQDMMPSDFVKDIGFNDPYCVPSPEVHCFMPDVKIVSGEACGEDVEITVTYKKEIYTLNVFYESTDKTEQSKMPRNYKEEVQVGDTYRVESPKIDGFTANIAVVSGTMEEKDADYTVKYSKIVDHSVSFDVKGGLPEISAQKVAHNHLATRPADPVKEGFTFDNWYIDETLTVPFDFNTPITSNILLIAKWK